MSAPFNQNDYLKSDSYISQKTADDLYLNATGDTINSLSVSNNLFVHSIQFADGTVQNSGASNGLSNQDVQTLINSSIDKDVIKKANTYTGNNIYSGTTSITNLNSTTLNNSGTITSNLINSNNGGTFKGTVGLPATYLQEILTSAIFSQSLMCQYNGNVLFRNMKIMGGYQFQTVLDASNNMKTISMFDGSIIIPTSLIVSNRNVLIELDNINTSISTYSNQLSNLNTKTTTLSYISGSGTTISDTVYITGDIFAKGTNILTNINTTNTLLSGLTKNSLGAYNMPSGLGVFGTLKLNSVDIGAIINNVNYKTTGLSYISGTGTIISTALYVSDFIYAKSRNILSEIDLLKTLTTGISYISGVYNMTSLKTTNLTTTNLTVGGSDINTIITNGISQAVSSASLSSFSVKDDFIHLDSHNGSGTLNTSNQTNFWQLNASDLASGYINVNVIQQHPGIYRLELKPYGSNNLERYFNIISNNSFFPISFKKTEVLFKYNVDTLSSSSCINNIISFGLMNASSMPPSQILTWTKADSIGPSVTSNNFYVNFLGTNKYTSTISSGSASTILTPSTYGSYVNKWMYLSIEKYVYMGTDFGFIFKIRDTANTTYEQFNLLYPTAKGFGNYYIMTTAQYNSLLATNSKPFFQFRTITNSKLEPTSRLLDLDYFGIDYNVARF